MKKLVTILLAAACVSAHGADLISFTAHLNGPNANPPNDSPFLATAKLSFGTTFVGGGPQWPGSPPSGVLTSNTLLALVYITPSNLVNSLGLTLGTATIQDAGGSVILILNRVTPSGVFPGPFPGGPGIPELIYSGFYILTPAQASDLLSGKWFVHISALTSSGRDYPAGQIRGRILRADTDGDGVPDDQDECPNTPSGVVVDGNGCSIEQLCPCEAPWKNHAQYVKCIRMISAEFREAGLISERERRDIIKEAEHSDCGHRH